MANVLECEPVLAPDKEAPAIRQLDSMLPKLCPPAAKLIGPDGTTLELPASVCQLLTVMVHELARGNAVTVVPVHAELTTQQAADLLNVSRPFLIKLLESGEISYRYVGTHRRVQFLDLMNYKRERSNRRRSGIAEMAREAQEMGLYE